MAETKRPAKSRKFDDVARPGKTAPSPNSRSVIISHRPIMRDPMMSAEQPEAEQADAPAPAAPTASVTRAASGAVIQPLANSTLTVVADEEPAETTEAEKTEEVAPEAEVVDSPAVTDDQEEETVAAKSEDEPVTPAAHKREEAPVRSGTGTDAKLGTKDAPSSDVELAAAEDAEAKRQAALQEMIESKKYYLPINTVEKRRTKQVVAIGVLLSLLLIAAWADIALDAGLIKIDHVHALTHFFN